MKKAIVPGYVVALLLIGFSGCEKNSGEAVGASERAYRRRAANCRNAER